MTHIRVVEADVSISTPPWLLLDAAAVPTSTAPALELHAPRGMQSAWYHSCLTICGVESIDVNSMSDDVHSLALAEELTESTAEEYAPLAYHTLAPLQPMCIVHSLKLVFALKLTVSSSAHHTTKDSYGIRPPRRRRSSTGDIP
jgi:hypothetical protein